MPVAHSFHHALAAPRSQCRFHLFLQNHFDHFPHPLPYRRLQPLPQRSLLALFHCNASLRHGVFLLCPEPPLKRFRDFSFNYFSGEYAFLFFYRNRDRTNGSCRPSVVISMTPSRPSLGKHIMDGVKPKGEVLPGEYAGARRTVRTQQKRIERKTSCFRSLSRRTIPCDSDCRSERTRTPPHLKSGSFTSSAKSSSSTQHLSKTPVFMENSESPSAAT